jgi:mRNA interferase RelE/StbE
MPTYALNVRPRARRALRQLDPTARQAVAAAIDALAADPRPPGAAPIKGHRPYLRVRVGDYRVIYAVDETTRAVRIAVVGHRREVYRNLDL